MVVIQFIISANAEAPKPESIPDITSKQYVYAINQPPQSKYIPPPKWTYCSCVEFAKWYILGSSKGVSWGNASQISPDSYFPDVGGLIITSEGGGHVGIVTGFDSENVYFVEANYYSCLRSERSLPLDSKKIKGYKNVKNLPQSATQAFIS